MDLSEMQLDALKELGNVGVGTASTALSTMLNKPVDIYLPEIKFIPVTEFASMVGDKESEVAALNLKISGGFEGESLFLFSKKAALEIVDLMMFQQPGTTKEFTDMEISAFKEMANVFLGIYLSSFGDIMKMKLFPGIPQFASDMAQSVVDCILSKLAQVADEVLVLKTQINIEGYRMDGKYFMLFEKTSLEKIITRLKELYSVE